MMFSLFQNLPYELRHEIWRYLIPEPRVVRAAHYLLPDKVYPKSTPPVLLHVCRESREFLLSPEIGFSMLLATPTFPATICANVKTDAIDFPLWTLLNGVKVLEFEAIIHLEIEGRCLRNEESADILRQLTKFPNLDTLSVVTPKAPAIDFLHLPPPIMGIYHQSPEWVETMQHDMEVAELYCC